MTKNKVWMMLCDHYLSHILIYSIIEDIHGSLVKFITRNAGDHWGISPEMIKSTREETMIRCVKSLTLQFIISSIKWYAYFIVVRRISALFTNATVKQGCLLSLAFCPLHIDKAGHLIYVFMQQELIEAIIIENT